jgi:hypothetical protein
MVESLPIRRGRAANTLTEDVTLFPVQTTSCGRTSEAMADHIWKTCDALAPPLLNPLRAILAMLQVV